MPLESSRTLLTSIFAIIMLALAVAAQPPTPSAREQLDESVRARARQDVKNKRPIASPGDLNLLFGQRAEKAGVPLNDVVDVYEDEYKKSEPAKRWYEPFIPNPGWIVAGILFILLILQDAVRKRIALWVESSMDKIYFKLVRFRYFRRRVLRRYRSALEKKYRHFPISFGSGRTLDMNRIYVPLRTNDGGEDEQLEDIALLGRYKRLVVVGAPGAGKSMFLKRIAFLYATGKLTAVPDTFIPVLVDLRRFNEKDKPVDEHIADIFTLNGYPDSLGFVRSSLSEGALLLLFDGLDEVNSSKRASEVAKLKDILDTYEDCPAVITCRSAVYRGEFSEAVERTVEIQEFADSQIYQFLESWPDMPESKSVEGLIKSLHERPRIMALARNPLLLTIIAFLYSDKEEFVLPFYRTEFYDRAVNELLLNKESLNKYDAAPKYYVLQQLALFNQEKTRGVVTDGQNDRVSMSVQTVLEQINPILPSLNLKPDDAMPLVREIVERSGLLLEMDNKTRYQFSHLTLQEYFAASALATHPNRLLDNFRGDRDAWRETVKLWCGQIHDSTKLIETIYRMDPVTGFECLADARVVDEASAEAIITDFKPRLANSDEAVVRAFAAVAAGTNARGRQVFDYLVGLLEAAEGFNFNETDLAAASALSKTNNPSAVPALLQRLESHPSIRAALTAMGDLAVPALAGCAASGKSECALALYEIGTPQAARALVPLLWHEEAYVRFEAAMFLGDLLRNKGVEEALRTCQLTPSQMASDEHLRFAWKPFAKTSGLALTSIAAQIFKHIDYIEHLSYEFSTGPHIQIDRRLIIPRIVSLMENMDYRILLNEEQTKLLFKEVHELGVPRTYFNLITKRIRQEFDEIDPLEIQRSLEPDPQIYSVLLMQLDPMPRIDLLLRLARSPRPSIEDWENLLRPSKFSFKSSPHFKIFRAALFLIYVGAAAAALYYLTSSATPFAAIYLGHSIYLIMFTAYVAFMSVDIDRLSNPAGFINLTGGFVHFRNFWRRTFIHSDSVVVIAIGIMFAMFLLLTPLFAAYNFYYFLRLLFLPPMAAVICTAALIAIVAALLRWGQRIDRLAQNPLTGILDTTRSIEDVLVENAQMLGIQSELSIRQMLRSKHELDQ